ncbi:hypothetical protein ACFV2H_12050 [Streptomyces sp. NPDC059629]|uniref:hypothetical protein n=1 Tax=Streptomyces sp. NPDC059629 TaxID=3346889 RepID=UPI0036B58532
MQRPDHHGLHQGERLAAEDQGREPAGTALRRALELTDFATGSVPLVANVDARAHQGGGHWRELSARQLVGPVRWADTSRVLNEELDATAFLDIGPGAPSPARPGAPCRRSRPTASRPQPA